MSRYYAILFILLLGFLGTGIETRYLHQVAVHETPLAWIPTVAAGIGTIACVAGMFRKKARTAAQFMFIIVALAGVGGIYLHTGFKPGPFLRLIRVEGDSQLMKSKDGDVVPPPTAPGILTGLSLIGLLALPGKRS